MEIDLKKILPKCPSETFLRELAVFAEEHTFDWSKDFFQHQIQARINRPQSHKDSWLTSRDLVMDGDPATRQKRRITEVEEEDNAASLLGHEGEAATPPEEKRNARAVLTLGTAVNSLFLTLLRSILLLPPHLVLQCPPIHRHKTSNQ